jgi:hypothetical protein
MLPDFNNLDITQYPMTNGYYTLGLLEHFRPDIETIYLRLEADTSNSLSHELVDYSWLEPKIDNILKKSKIACVIPWDEGVCFIRNKQLETILNKYVNDKVYFLTNLEDYANEIYKKQHLMQGFHLLKLKIIELPFWLLNDCLTYYRTVDRNKIQNFEYDKSYLCMIGNAIKTHKQELMRRLKYYDLAQYGINTFTKQDDIPQDLADIATLNPIPPYTEWNPLYQKMAAQKQVNGVWISSNVENYIKIEKYYPNIPLMINAETVPIKFFVTEKSIWPALIGRMFLLSGRPRLIKYVQRFYDFDIKKYSNIDYDLLDGFGNQDQLDRIDALISKNIELIKYSKDLYLEFKPELEAARWSFGANMYRYFVDQIAKIV